MTMWGIFQLTITIGAICTNGSVLDVPILEKSPWVYECSLVKTVPQDHCCIYISEIKNIQVDNVIEDTTYGKIDLNAIDPLIYAPGNYYKLGTKIGSVGYSKVVN
ncbi:hypothetical protein E4665_15950 [Sporolactobacillus shoreae]|uniref:Flavin reductase like domain-containing protein n=2 Tax=Sporolactobacillus shoreae TaxID=1465501 RepID=A0A4Z0GKM7_9BACL|nr:hypothetical protein E4665_15950 [Sporolactobacillus shoreae]